MEMTIFSEVCLWKLLKEAKKVNKKGRQLKLETSRLETFAAVKDF